MTPSGTPTQAQTADTPEEAGNWFPENLALITHRLAEIATQKANKVKKSRLVPFQHTCSLKQNIKMSGLTPA